MLSRMFFSAFIVSAMLTPVPAPAQSQSDATAPIKSLHEQWANDWKSRDFAALQALYAQDAVLLPAEHSIIEGRENIGGQLQKMIEASPSNSSFFFVADAVEVSGDLAYESGFIQYWPTSRSAPVKGFYILILKRDASGKWLISRQALTQISATDARARAKASS